MPSLFAGLAAAASATVDAVFAEEFRILARAAPAIAAPVLANGRPDVNAERVARPGAPAGGVSFFGVFVEVGSTIHAHGRGMADSTTRPIVTDRPMIDVDIAAFRALAARPKADDIIVRVDTGERFKVTDPWKTVDLGRAQIWLAEG